MRWVAASVTLAVTGVGSMGLAAAASRAADPGSDATTVVGNAPGASTDAFHGGAGGAGGGIVPGAKAIANGSVTQGFADVYLGAYLGETETTRGTSFRDGVDPPTAQTVNAAQFLTQAYVEHPLQVGVGDLLAGPLHPVVGPATELVLPG
jgi:hypothetical protein